MLTVYDFVNKDIESKHMRTGWKIEACDGRIVLRYTVLNFDWSSLEYIGNDLWNMFLGSKSYSGMKAKLERAMKKFKRLHLEAYSISDLKVLAAEYGLKVDVDKIVRKMVQKKAAEKRAETAFAIS